jgi:AcrR family transcriptional regulator
MSRAQEAKAETRQLILRAAYTLFRKNGPEKCTIRQIAEQAGVSPASVIVHFKNKTALLEVALSEDINKVFSKALATLPEGERLEQVVTHIVSAIFSLYEQDRSLYRVLIRDTFFEPAQESPAMAELDKKYSTFLINLLKQEQQQGRIRQDIDVVLAASSLFSLYFGVLRDFLRIPEFSAVQAEQKLAACLQQYLMGISTERGEQ